MCGYGPGWNTANLASVVLIYGSFSESMLTFTSAVFLVGLSLIDYLMVFDKWVNVSAEMQVTVFLPLPLPGWGTLVTDLATAKYQTDKDKCVMLMSIPILILSAEGSSSVYLSNGIIMTDASEASKSCCHIHSVQILENGDLETSIQLRDSKLIRHNQSQMFPFLCNMFSRCGIWVSLALHTHGWTTSNSMSQTFSPTLAITVILRYYKWPIHRVCLRAHFLVRALSTAWFNSNV